MARERLRKRTVPRLKCVHYAIIFFVSFTCGLIAFSVAFYASSNYFRSVVNYLFFEKSNNLDTALSVADIYEFYKSQNFPGKGTSVNIDYYLRYHDFSYEEPATLNYKSAIYNDNIKILFRLPTKTTITALLLIFPSCRETAYDWFHTYERQRIIGGAIELGYVCLVFQATDNSSGCWSNTIDINKNRDAKMVLRGLGSFYKEYSYLAPLPLFTFGLSNGGLFSSIFAINRYHKIQGQVLSISIVHPEILNEHVKRKRYPPTVWIRMIRDIEFASESRISMAQEIFMKTNISFQSLAIEPVHLTYTVFRERIPVLSASTSRYLLHQLYRNRWINIHGYLMFNPRRKFDWIQFLFPTPLSANLGGEVVADLKRYKSQISEFLNTAYGEHAVSYERSYEALKWLKEVYDLSKSLTNSTY